MVYGGVVYDSLERLIGLQPADFKNGTSGIGKTGTPSDVSRLGALYRAACADLALAYAYQLPQNTVQYLLPPRKMSRTDLATALANPNHVDADADGMVAMPNVNPVEEMANMITTQRSFEMNSQAVQAADQMMQVVANLRKF